MKFERKRYWAIYVDKKENINRVKEIIKLVDKYEYNYMPKDLLKTMDEFWSVSYVHKFTDVDMDVVSKICFDEGIFILCIGSYDEYWFSKEIYSLKYYIDNNSNT